ncbi:lipopolysaccharide biosynthesis protein [Flavobacteriaceae bacterium GF1]
MNFNSSKESATKKGISGILWNFSGSIVTVFLQLFVIGILARLLTPEEFGVVAIIMILVSFSDLFREMGIGSALIQLPNIHSKHISLGFTLSLIIGLTIGILFYLLAPWIGTFFELQNADLAIQFFAIFFPLRSVSSVSGALLRRNLQFSLLVKIDLISYISGSGIIAIVLAYLNYGYWSLILGQFASLMISLIILTYFKRPRFSFRFHKKVVRDLLYFGSGHTLGSVFNYFAENADNIVVGKLYGTVVLGIYSKAFQIMSMPAMFFGKIFDRVLFPILAQKQDQKKKLSDFYLFSNSLCFALLIPIAVLIFINAELIVNTLLGDQWQEVIVPLKILILGLAYRFGTKINKSYIKALGIIYRGAYYQLIFALLMVSSTLIGGYYFGLNGVAFGVLNATVLNYLQVSYRLYKELKFPSRYYYALHIKVLALSAPFIIFTMLLYYYNITSQWIHLVITITLYVPVMLFVFIHKDYIVFNNQNSTIITQVLQVLPSVVKQKLMKIRVLRKYNA